MKISHLASGVGLLLLAVGQPSLHAMELGPEVHMEGASKGTQASPFPVEGSMCGKSDRVVFSCPVADGNKGASMCAGGDIASEHVRFYYAYGRPGTPELTYPTKNQADVEFTARILVSRAIAAATRLPSAATATSTWSMQPPENGTSRMAA